MDKVQETFKETMAIISSLKEEVDLLSEQTKARFENQTKLAVQERDVMAKKILLEMEPFKTDITYLKERELSMSQELSLVIGRNIQSGVSTSLN